MSLLDFFSNLFKKKQPEKEEVVVIRNFKQVDYTYNNEDGEIFCKDYIEAGKISPHLKVSGTKYYVFESVPVWQEELVVKLYLRCRYDIVNGKRTREHYTELTSRLPALTTRSETVFGVNLIELLKDHIDYVLIDKDEITGEIYYYYSFKGVKDIKEENKEIEGYLVLDGRDLHVDYIRCLM